MTIGSKHADLLRSDRLRRYVSTLRELRAPADLIEKAEQLLAEVIKREEQQPRPATPPHQAHP